MYYKGMGTRDCVPREGRVRSGDGFGRNEGVAGEGGAAADAVKCAGGADCDAPGAGAGEVAAEGNEAAEAVRWLDERGGGASG